MDEKLNKYSMKGFKDKLKENGIFYTDSRLAEKMKKIALEYVNDFDEVYDPTCGRGNLLHLFDEDIKKYGQDLNEIEIDVATENIPNFIGAKGDIFLNPYWIDKKFKIILANPPFSVKWTPLTSEDERFKDVPTIPTGGRADYAFIIHILHYLSDDGVAVVLNFPGVLYRGNRDKILRQWLVEKNYIESIEEIPSGYFEDTTIDTVLITFRKNKENTNIKIIKDGKEKIITVEEVKEWDYDLAPKRYIPNEIKREEIDIYESLNDTTKYKQCSNNIKAINWCFEMEMEDDEVDYEKLKKAMKENKNQATQLIEELKNFINEIDSKLITLMALK